jgi:predicted DNA-binding antitoxin AbrB/MazE fold protein
MDAVYENGVFRPLQSEVLAIAEGKRVRITVDDEGEPQALRLAVSVYDGLSDHDIREIEGIALDRGTFFGPRSDR